jgi:hypothetical protein
MEWQLRRVEGRNPKSESELNHGCPWFFFWCNASQICVTKIAVAHPARLVIEEVGGDNLEIVVRGVGEGAFAVAIPESPNKPSFRGGLR